KNQFMLLFWALFLAVFVGSVDISIGGPALDIIAAELGEQVLLPWFGAAYTISEGVIPIICGSFADIFGCKAVFIVSFVVFEIGSVVCGFAKSMRVLIVGRALSGIGGSAILPLACTFVSQLAPHDAAAKYIAILGGAFGLGSITGSLIGGVLTSIWSWRLCFLINLPISLLVFGCMLPTTSTVVPFVSMREKLRKIDYFGIVLLLGFSLTLDIPLQLGGTVWMWDSVQVISLFSLSAVLLSVFLVVQLRVVENPLIPKIVLSNKKVLVFAAISFMSSAALYVITYYAPFYTEFVFEVTPMSASLISLNFTFGCITASLISGWYFTKTGRFDVFFLIGPILYSAQMVILTQLNKELGVLYLCLGSIVGGFGLGLILQLRFSALHSVVSKDMISTSTGFISASMGMGGCV
ncbi:MFS general substrate transporter, partial [Rhizoclosmatium globosum]